MLKGGFEAHLPTKWASHSLFADDLEICRLSTLAWQCFCKGIFQGGFTHYKPQKENLVNWVQLACPPPRSFQTPERWWSYYFQKCGSPLFVSEKRFRRTGTLFDSTSSITGKNLPICPSFDADLLVPTPKSGKGLFISKSVHLLRFFVMMS